MTDKEEYTLPAGTYVLGDSVILADEVRDVWDVKANFADGLFGYRGSAFACIHVPDDQDLYGPAGDTGLVNDTATFAMADQELVEPGVLGPATVILSYVQPVTITATRWTAAGERDLTLLLESPGSAPLKFTTVAPAPQVPFFNLT